MREPVTSSPGRAQVSRSGLMYGVAVAAAVLYAITLGWFAIASHHALTTQMNDLGNSVQAIWSASQGDLRMTVSNDPDARIKSRLAVHFNILYYPIALLYAAVPHPEMLLILSTLGCALAGLGIYAYARLQAGEARWTLLLPLAFFLHPMVHDANLYDFKIVTIATAALIWSLWAFDSGRVTLGCVLASLVLLAQEDHALMVIGLGVYLMLTGRRRLGAIVASVAVVYLALVMLVFVPAISGGEGLSKISGARNRLGWLGGDPWSIVRTIASKPIEVAAHLFRPDRLRLPVYLFASAGVCAWAAPRVLVILVPLTVGSMLSSTVWMTQLTGTYYHVPAVAIILIAVARAASRSAKFSRAIAGISLGSSLLFSILLSPLPHSLVSSWANYPDPAASRELLRQAAIAIPADASVAAQNNLGPWLAHRREIVAFPQHMQTARFVAFRPRCDFGPSSGLFPRTSLRTMITFEPAQLIGIMTGMIGSPQWAVVAVQDGTWVFERNGARGLARPVALALLQKDTARFYAECNESARGNVPWRRLIVGRYGWGDVPAVLSGQ